MIRTLTLFLFLISYNLTATSDFDVSVDGTTVQVKNRSGHAVRMEIRRQGKIVKEGLVGNGYSLNYDTKTVPSRGTLRGLSAYAEYSKDAFELDLATLENIKAARERQRERNAIWAALLAAADEYFFNGFFSNAITVVNMYSIATDARLSDEDKLLQLFKEAGGAIPKTNFEDRRLQAAATGLITYLETSFSDDEVDARDQDLVQLGMHYAMLFARGDEASMKNLSKAFTWIPKYNFDVAIGAGVVYDVVDYNFVEYDRNNALPLTYYGDYGTTARPLYLGWHNRWVKSGSTSEGYNIVALNLAYEQSPVFYFAGGNADFAAGRGLQQRSALARFSYSFRGGTEKSGIDVGPAIGGGATQIRTVQFSGRGDELTDLEFGEFDETKFIFSLGLNAHLTLNRINFFARYGFNTVLTDTPDGKPEDSAAYRSHTLHTGVALTLFRSYRRK